MTIPTLASGRLGLAAAALAFASLLMLPTPAHASEGYAQLWSQLMVANANAAGDSGQWGPGMQLGVGAGITDFWSVAGGVEGSYHFAQTDEDAEVPAAQIWGFFGGFRYNLDVFQYVPYVGLSLENFVSRPPNIDGAGGAALGGKLTIGLDWRYARHWSVGGMVELHAPLADPGNFPIYSTLGVNWAYHFRL